MDVVKPAWGHYTLLNKTRSSLLNGPGFCILPGGLVSKQVARLDNAIIQHDVRHPNLGR